MSDDQVQRPVTVSRDELYSKIWATPMSRLAQDYGISGRGLSKICDRLDVPHPPAWLLGAPHACMQRPHPIVAGWIKERQARREDARRWHVGGPLPAVFTAIERHGFVAKVDGRGHTLLNMDGEPIPLTLKEIPTGAPPLTEEEKQHGFNPKRPWKSET